MYIGAIDVGGTKTMAWLVDGSGRLLLSKQIPTQTASPALHFQRCAQLLREVTAQYGIPFSSLEGVGVSLPGTVDESHQVLTMAPGSGWRDLPAAQMLREQLGHQLLWCDNDVNNCARAELRFAGAPADFLWITVSTGIGEHSEETEKKGDDQFEIDDGRSVQEVYDTLLKNNLQPVMSDYIYV